MRSESTIGSTRRLVAAYLVLLVLSAAFFATFFNRFAGVRSGDGEFTGGMALLAGRLPYRDYYTAGPPLNAIKSALLLKVFGHALIVNRTAAVAERLSIAAMIFCWLRRIFGTEESLLGALVAIILSAGDRTDPLASYNHDAIFFAVLAGLLASLALSGSRGRLNWSALGSGSVAGLCLLTKQTVGIGVVVCLWFVPAVLLRGSGRHRSPAWQLLFLVGCGLPLCTAVLLLHRFGILESALRMLFIQGPAAKAGHPADFAVRAGLVAWDSLGWVVLGAFWLLLGRAALCRSTSGGLPLDDEQEHGPAQRDALPSAAWLAVLTGEASAALMMGCLLAGLPALHDLTKSVVYGTSAGLMLVLWRLFKQNTRNALSIRQAEFALMASLSAAVALTLALSWPAFEAMLLPGLAVIVAALLSGLRPSQRPVAYVLLLFLGFMQLREKLSLPFGFDLQDEARVSSATKQSEQAQLAGILLPASTVALLDGTVDIVRRRTTSRDTVFTYPEMGLIYPLTGRNPPTFSGSHNIDVLNDSLAHEEAERLRLGKPAVILYYRETEPDLLGAERLWRRGRPSGQRELIATIEELIRSYDLAASYVLRAGDPPIMVFVRRTDSR